MRANLVGKSLVVFSLTMLIGSFVVALLLMAGLFIDLTALITLAIARSVIRGSIKAAKWSIVLMVWYIAVGICLICVTIFAPERVRVSGITLQPQQIVWVIPVMGIIMTWCAVNTAFLLRFIKRK